MLICLGSISLALPRQNAVLDSCKKNDCQLSPTPHSSNPLPVAKIQQIADSITVKVLSKEFSGSGTLLKKERHIYTVITNAHVLRAAKPPYRIQTPDGHIYQATAIETVKLDGNDLGLLQFRSQDQVYAVASLGDSSSLGVGDKVFVGGFTADGATKLPKKGEEDKNNSLRLRLSPSPHLRQQRDLVFTTGEVSLLLEKALKGGYQIGYTNDIRKGMSGAPLLNIRGEVVGINGLHKEPLWDAADLYEDGTEPSKPLQEKITRASFAVPLRTVFKQFPQLDVSSISRQNLLVQ
ncbi:MAG: trypsin-like peptidase domain-containing protein [Richelia sp. RM2_1_2]|nr:trypsin-like peptidase domain-containing protein [Richelia sp. SM2_1_7]NJN11367.1 trypsin-like peptidase domain-containing protein [Richelia sp. RM1_1_1]NJO63102.1 trypsin-like peptidase domain-containing protein [Richelia sp. RM2_1_2]